MALSLTLLPGTALAEEAPALSQAAQTVQELIDALPDADNITAENADAVAARLDEIDEAKLALTDDELDLLDFTKYDAAGEILNGVSYDTELLKDTGYGIYVCGTEITSSNALDVWGTARFAIRRRLKAAPRS